MSAEDLNRRLRALPSVEELASRMSDLPHSRAVEAARATIEARRTALVGGAGSRDDEAAEGNGAGRRGTDTGTSGSIDIEELERDARQRAAASARRGLRRVINATGVVIHTNLGRAPLARAAADAAAEVGASYSSLEYDLDAGRRGSRQAHVEALVRELTGTEAALAVNNGAAAVLLAASALAAGREIVVSRGQLVEIGGSFRIPDVVEASGARLVEVGTTNRTRIADYERAIGPETGALLRVHPSNFRTVGFVEEVAIEELCELARRAGAPVIDDVGSGAVAAAAVRLGNEPTVARSVAAGCAVVCFSGDKLLGGPQAGVMAGTAEAIERCRTHPLARAVRIDKLSLAALEATLRLLSEPEMAERDVPVLRMLTAPPRELEARAERMRAHLAGARVEASVERGAARAGGGSLPTVELEGPVCAISPGELGLDALAERLRAAGPPVIGRASEGRLILDPRTLDDEEADLAASTVAAVLSGARR